MSEKTQISWCDSTVNFWSGCTKVSPGCANCYAEKLSKRAPKTFGQWGPGAPRKVHESAFQLAHRLNRKPWICDQTGESFAECDISRYAQGANASTFHRRRIFVDSMSDIFDPEAPIDAFARTLDTIRLCPDVDWLLVSKRIELWAERALLAYKQFRDTDNQDGMDWVDGWLEGAPPSNVWIGATVENQEMADKRIPELLKIPAVVRFMSCEPLLGPIELGKDALAGIHWIIAGGESGKHARPCNVDWIRGIKDQCMAANVPVFVKQLGSWMKLKHPKGGDPAEWPTDLRVQQFPIPDWLCGLPGDG